MYMASLWHPQVQGHTPRTQVIEYAAVHFGFSKLKDNGAIPQEALRTLRTLGIIEGPVRRKYQWTFFYSTFDVSFLTKCHLQSAQATASHSSFDSSSRSAFYMHYCGLGCWFFSLIILIAAGCHNGCLGLLCFCNIMAVIHQKFHQWNLDWLLLAG